ncbi:unnamed protein product, partial [Musa acuminata subsp. burmannicoides]
AFVGGAYLLQEAGGVLLALLGGLHCVGRHVADGAGGVLDRLGPLASLRLHESRSNIRRSDPTTGAKTTTTTRTTHLALAAGFPGLEHLAARHLPCLELPKPTPCLPENKH